MKSRTLYYGVVFSLLLFSASLSIAQPADQQEAMKKWMEYMTPGTAHQSFAKMVGNWKAIVTVFDAQSGEQNKSEGSAAYEMVLGGKYLKSTFKGIVMGMPYEGMGLDAYDNATKEYISIWIDNMGTGVMYMKGKWDDDSKSFIYTGNVVNPMTGKEEKNKNVLKITDDDHMVMTSYTFVGEKEVKQMEIQYSRM
jgi:hypothetical protein